MRAAVFLLCLLAWGARAASPVDVAPQLHEAEDLAIKGQGDAAIDGYRSLLERGVDFPGLRYNLGTLYLEQGDLGRAVLHLRTALARDPRHDDARYNLERALGARADELDGPPRPRPAWSYLSGLVRSSEAALFFGAAWLSFCLVLASWPWTRRGTGLRRVTGAAVVVAAAALVLCAGLLGARLLADATLEAVILDGEVSARVAPSADAAVAFVAHAGLFGEVVEEEAGWLRLRLENGLDAWLPRAALGLVGEATAP